jgi:hypothetical protein
MATPDLHEAFWVAIATAAPVIGLASAVTAEQTARRTERAVERALKEDWRQPRTPVFAYTITYGNIMLQTVVLAIALYSLGTHHDGSGTRVTAALLTLAGMVLVFLPSWINAVRLYFLASYFRRAATTPQRDAAARPERPDE